MRVPFWGKAEDHVHSASEAPATPQALLRSAVNVLANGALVSAVARVASFECWTGGSTNRSSAVLLWVLPDSAALLCHTSEGVSVTLQVEYCTRVHGPQ